MVNAVVDIDLTVILVPMLSELVPFRPPAICHGITVFGAGEFVEDTHRFDLLSHIDARVFLRPFINSMRPPNRPSVTCAPFASLNSSFMVCSSMPTCITTNVASIRIEPRWGSGGQTGEMGSFSCFPRVLDKSVGIQYNLIRLTH